VTSGVAKTSYFGEVSMDGVDLAVMDGGTHGVQGHALYVGPGGGARWKRSVDGLRPEGRTGEGTIALSGEERAWLDRAVAQARALALAGTTRFFGGGPPRPPRWVWAIVVRHQGRLLQLEGGGIAATAAPPALAPLLAWLRERVDREAGPPG